MKNTDMKERFDSLQFFRGMAAIIVVLYHLGFVIYDENKLIFLNKIFSNGWTGVDFFFVLSGFIIAYMHYTDIELKKGLKAYILKRLIRIYPIYWVIFFLFLILYGITKKDMLANNDFAYYIKSFFLIFQEKEPLVRVAWTLSYELFFYSIFALFICIGMRFTRLLFFCWLILILILQFVMPQFLSISVVDVLFNIFVLQFFVGCLAGVMTKRIKLINWNLSYLSFIGVFFFVLISVLLYYKVILRANDWTRIYLALSSVLIILGCTIGKSSISFPRVFNTIGDASYLLYLIHLIPNLFIAKLSHFFLIKVEFLREYPILFINCFGIIGTGFTVLFAIQMHRYIEKPLLKILRERFLGKRNSLQNLP